MSGLIKATGFAHKSCDTCKHISACVQFIKWTMQWVNIAEGWCLRGEQF